MAVAQLEGENTITIEIKDSTMQSQTLTSEASLIQTLNSNTNVTIISKSKLIRR